MVEEGSQDGIIIPIIAKLLDNLTGNTKFSRGQI